MTNPLLSTLGYPADARVVLFHADDVGMCHGSNQAFLELVGFGIVKSGSIMFPCPWSPEIVAACRANPTLDVGVHLTLTSEWSSYRWGPISTCDPASGLLDAAGYFWQRAHQTRAAMDPVAAMAEMSAQMASARQAGVAITHIDSHMGTIFAPELLAHYLQLALEYQVPPLLTRDGQIYADILQLDGFDPTRWREQVASWEAAGLPIFDHFLITPGHHPQGRAADRADLYEAQLRNLPLGTVTFFSLHPNAPGDIEVILPEKAYWRTFEYEYFRSQQLYEFLQQEEIISINFGDIKNAITAQTT